MSQTKSSDIHGRGSATLHKPPQVLHSTMIRNQVVTLMDVNGEQNIVVLNPNGNTYMLPLNFFREVNNWLNTTPIDKSSG